MKIKVSETTNPQLDLAVHTALNYAPIKKGRTAPPYSTDWAQGGPIIERELIRVVAPSIQGIDWTALIQHHPIGLNNWSQGFGPTPLIAAMRAFVASKLGYEVEVPEELTA